MGDAQRPVSPTCSLDKLLAPERFAYISAGSCTPEDVDHQSMVSSLGVFACHVVVYAWCPRGSQGTLPPHPLTPTLVFSSYFFLPQIVSSIIPAKIQHAANSKMFLRSFWFCTTARGVAAPDEMHIYTLAAFLLQLGLLELQCSALPHSMLAASALSLALMFFEKATWLSALRSFGAYSLADLAPCRQLLAAAQAAQGGHNLRVKWNAQYMKHDYSNFQDEWRAVLALMAQPCDAFVTLLGASGLEPAVPCCVPMPRSAGTVVAPRLPQQLSILVG